MYITASVENCRLAFEPRTPDIRPISRELGRYPTANIGDAQERFGLMRSTIVSRVAGGSCAGPALTILTREGDNLAIHRALDEAQPGDILVVNGAGDTCRAVFGDLLADVCLSRGVAGVVIDGAVRDVEAIAELGIPVWASAVTPAGPTKNGPGVIGAPISCGGLIVRTDDIVVADSDGVAVVPRERAADVLAALVVIEQNEAIFRSRVRAGTPR